MFIRDGLLYVERLHRFVFVSKVTARAGRVVVILLRDGFRRVSPLPKSSGWVGLVGVFDFLDGKMRATRAVTAGAVPLEIQIRRLPTKEAQLVDVAEPFR